MNILARTLLPALFTILLSPVPVPAATAKTDHIVLAGGCFWGMEAVFERLRGVKQVVAGYTGGSAATANYETVSTGTTGQAESVDITFDPAQISLRKILDVYFTVAHDPTQLDYQGPDHGSQYRSAIFYTNRQQEQLARTAIAELKNRHVYKQAIVTQVVPLQKFYAAEEYHQNYYNRHPDQPYIVFEDAPKVRALQKRFPQLLVR